MNCNTLAVLSAMFLSVSSQAVTIKTHQHADGFPFLIPSVQKLAKTQGTFTLPAQLTVASPAETAHEVAVLDSILSNRLAVSHAVAVSQNQAAACTFVLTTQDVPEHRQGYSLSITPQGITIKARTPQGIFYGVQTLGNFIVNCSTAALPCCDIMDWPDLDIRGIFLDIRWLKDADAPQFARTFDMLGSMKLNAIELDCGANLPFEDSPFTNYKSTISKENLAKIIQAAKDNYVEIVPHLQVISHNQWLRAHPKYLTDITATGEDKTRKYNSTWNSCNCPAKPLGRELTDYTIRETIKLFKPRYFHLCLDELELCNWRKCETCKEPHTVQQIVDEVKHTVDYVKSLNVRPVVYQDSMLAARSNNSILVEPLLKIMPRDAVISFWDYSITPQTTQFKHFQELGFKDIVGVSFCYRLANTMTLPLMVKNMGGNGSILTYWGWIGKLFLDNSQNNSNAAASTVIHAEYSWRAHQDYTHATMPYDPAYQLRMRLPLPCSIRRPEDAFATIPMAQFCDTQIGDDVTFPRLTPELADTIRREAAALPEKFAVQTTSDNHLAALVLGGGNDDYARRAVTIPVKAKMKGMSFLMTAGIPDNPDAFGYRFSRFMPPFASLKITYANGRTVNQILRYRLHVNNWNEQSSGAESRFVIRGNDVAGNTFSFFAFDWDNPTPDETINTLQIAPEEKHGVALALFAVSAWQPLSPLPQQTALPANLRNHVDGLQGINAKPTDITDFNKRGLGDCSVRVEGKFADMKPSWKLIDMPDAPIPGKALEIIVPPQAPGVLGRSRAILDIPVKPNTPLKAMVADYRVIGEYRTNAHNGFYRTNHDMSKYEVCYGGIISPSDDWQHIVIPETRMPAEFDAPLSPEEYTTVRFSIWFEANTKPVRFIINRIGYYDFCAGWMQQLLRDKITE